MKCLLCKNYSFLLNTFKIKCVNIINQNANFKILSVSLLFRLFSKTAAPILNELSSADSKCYKEC